MRRNCVTLVCNEGYVEHALFVAHQLDRLVDRNFDIVICSDKHIENSATDLDVIFRQIDVSGFVEGLTTSARLKQYTYWRLPAIESLAGDYNRILYLDTDVFVSASSLAELFVIDMQGAAIAAVRDVHQRSRSKRMPNEFAALGWANSAYFNAGVLLIDGNAWLAADSFSRISKVADNYRDALFCHDQSLLNMAFYNDWLELAPVWNWQYSPKVAMFGEYFSPRLVHFSGAEKIWSAPSSAIPYKYWAEYEMFSSRYMRKAASKRYPEFGAERSESIWRALLKTLWYFRSNMRYAKRFRSDIGTIRHSS